MAILKGMTVFIGLSFGYSTVGVSQDSTRSRFGVQAHFLMELTRKGDRFGGMVECNRTLSQSADKSRELRIGMVGDFYRGRKTLFEHYTNRTQSYVLALTLTNRWHLLKHKKLRLANTLYFGGNHMTIHSTFEDVLNDRTLEDNSTSIDGALGAYWKAGYVLGQRLGVQALIKSDVSILLDSGVPLSDLDVAWMYGLGMTYRIL